MAIKIYGLYVRLFESGREDAVYVGKLRTSEKMAAELHRWFPALVMKEGQEDVSSFKEEDGEHHHP